MPSDEDDIRAVAQTYLDGLYEGDGDKLAAAFHPTSALASVDAAGTLAVVPRDAWIEAVRNRAAPQATGLARGDAILMVDIASPTTALVKLRCQIPPRFFTDYLSFLKIDGHWQVAQKIFAARSEPVS